MKKGVIVLAFLFGFLNFVSAECITPYNGMILTEDTTFCQGKYPLTNAIKLSGDGITLDCNGAKLIGDMDLSSPYYSQDSAGIMVDDGTWGTTVKNCNVENFYVGILTFFAYDTTLENNKVSSNKYGILFFRTLYSKIINNEVKNNIWDNIPLIVSGQNLIENNTIEDSANSGIDLIRRPGFDGDGYNIIRKNSFKKNRYAISIYDRGYHQIIQNEFKENKFIEEKDNKFINIDFYNTSNNQIWGNIFFGGMFRGENYGILNNFCMESIGNIYRAKASGPTC